MFDALELACAIAAAVASAGFGAWFFYDVFWLHRSGKPGARYEPDRQQLRKLQAKRRLALRRLGNRWVLHPSQPPVKWGHSRG